MPDKEKKEKEVDQFRVGEVKDVGAGEDVLFQNTGTLYYRYKSCLNLDGNCDCYFPLFIYTNAGHILEFICTCFFSLFSWLSWFRG